MWTNARRFDDSGSAHWAFLRKLPRLEGVLQVLATLKEDHFGKEH